MGQIDPKRVLLVVVMAAGLAALFQLAALVLALTSGPPREVAQIPAEPAQEALAASPDPSFPPITPFPMTYVDPGPLVAPSTPTPTPAVEPLPHGNRDRCGAQPNPWNYTFCGGSLIFNPPPGFCRIFPCVRDFQANGGYIVQCGDGLFSATGGTSRACQRERGVARTLYGPGPDEGN